MRRRDLRTDVSVSDAGTVGTRTDSTTNRPRERRRLLKYDSRGSGGWCEHPPFAVGTVF
jgi:hypothetical protein